MLKRKLLSSRECRFFDSSLSEDRKEVIANSRLLNEILAMIIRASIRDCGYDPEGINDSFDNNISQKEQFVNKYMIEHNRTRR